MARTRADVREAELLEDLADRALVVSDAEALGHDLLQVHPAPAHDSMHGALRAGFNDLGELRQLLRREARRVALRPAVLEPFGAPFIEAVHPVPQGLAVHATEPRGSWRASSSGSPGRSCATRPGSSPASQQWRRTGSAGGDHPTSRAVEGLRVVEARWPDSQPVSHQPMASNGTRCRPLYQDRDARISILARVEP